MQSASLGGGAGRGTSESSDESTTNTLNLPSGTHTQTETYGLTAKRVTVSVSIPESYLVNIWKQRNPTAPDAEPVEPDAAALDTIQQDEADRIKVHVANLLPEDPTVPDPLDLVKVSFFPSVAVDPIVEPGMGENALVWLGQSWATLGTLGMALFGLMMLRSMLNAPPIPPAGSHPSLLAESTGDDDDDSVEGKAARSLGRFSGTGASLRDELTELVDEDTEAAANILKTWIGNVG